VIFYESQRTALYRRRAGAHSVSHDPVPRRGEYPYRPRAEKSGPAAGKQQSEAVYPVLQSYLRRRQNGRQNHNGEHSPHHQGRVRPLYARIHRIRHGQRPAGILHRAERCDRHAVRSISADVRQGLVLLAAG